VDSAQFVFMGGEPSEIALQRERARRVGAAGRCTFAGKRPTESLSAFLGIADVLVSPRARGTNTPFKLYTYLASGKPVVATRIEAHTQLLTEPTAFLVEPSAAGIAAGIREVLADPAAAAARAARARETIEREYSRTRYLEKVAQAYAGILAAASPRAAGQDSR